MNLKTFCRILVFFILCMGSVSQSLAQETLNTLPDLKLPGLQNFEPNNSVENSQLVKLEAILQEGGEPINQGLIWRVFDPTPDADGKFSLIEEKTGGSAEIDFEPGDYFVHVAFGRASVTKRLTVTEGNLIPTQQFVLDAGGVILKAVAGDNRIISNQFLTFSIYSGEDQNALDNERQLVMENVKPDVIVRLNEGTYHVVSKYGDVNAVTRADIRVIKGQLTEVQMKHRAAEIAFKLVSKEGGEAIADTSWTIYSSTGDIMREMVGVYPKLVLSEGNYSAVAYNQGQEFSRNFHVSPGENKDIEVLLDGTR